MVPVCPQSIDIFLENTFAITHHFCRTLSSQSYYDRICKTAKRNCSLTGLSVRALFMDFISQLIILLYLIEMESSLLMTIPTAFGVIIALWKCQRGSGLKFVKIEGADESDEVAFYNRIFRLTGYELQATRLKVSSNKSKEKKGKAARGGRKSSDKVDLVTLSIEMDALATRTLGKYVLLPIVFGYTIHSLIME